ncbi:ParA family protein [Thiolapillus sp.]|uniref:ParA family protein n=4 Tax=Thiolapillus sp. TaxID=2017437 RepID=UPI003AF48325
MNLLFKETGERKMKTIAITNQKGGVGKTTIAVHLAFDLRDKGKQVLFIDSDPQGNSTLTLGNYLADAKASMMFSEPLSFKPENGLNVIGADAGLADIERADPVVIKQFMLNINNFNDTFDYCIIDTPPTMGLRMTAAIMVSDFVVSPIELESYSISGITTMLQTIFGIKEKYNNKLVFVGMVPNRFNPRSIDQKNTFIELVKNYAHLIIQAKIGIRSSIPEALVNKIPVWEVKKTAAKKAAEEIKNALNLIYEVMEKNNG